MLEILAAIDVAEDAGLKWLIGGGVGTATVPLVVWRIWSWLRKRASMSATIKIGQEVVADNPKASDSFSQEECDKKHRTIGEQLSEMHVSMDDGFARVTSRLDTMATRMDNIVMHMLKDDKDT